MTYLVITEGFERFSYYGMQSLLVLYIAGRLLTPDVEGHVLGLAVFRHILESGFGRLTNQALAILIFGIYGGTVYALPILGGLIGDRFGRRRIIIVGLVVTAFGHFMMAFESIFLLALVALLTGSGLLKGNIAAQVRSLYGPTDPRLDQAYSTFYMAMNIGSALAPFLCGTLGELCGWWCGFTAAGVVTVIGLVIYLRGQRYLPVDHAPRPKAEAFERILYRPSQIVGIAAMLLVATLFWTTASQGWNTYNLWVRDRVDRFVCGFAVPVTWFQIDSSVASIVLAPMIIWLWRWQGSRGEEPHELSKVAWGCFTLAAATLVYSLAEIVAGDAKIPILWPLAYDWLGAVGYLYVAPVVVAWFSRIAPSGRTGTIIAIYYLSICAGSFLSGWLGRLYGVVSNAEFWAIHAAITACGALLLLATRKRLMRALDSPRPALANNHSRARS